MLHRALPIVGAKGEREEEEEEEEEEEVVKSGERGER